MTTPTLPLAFAHADLHTSVGWKSQLEAAERLSRDGAAISGNVLFALYTSRRPSASGGVWDRAHAIQKFETALRINDTQTLQSALPAAWDAMQTVKTEITFARQYGLAVAKADLNGDALELAIKIGLLSPDYEAVALLHPQSDPFLNALARGVPQNIETTDPQKQAISAAFGTVRAPQSLGALAEDDKIGEAILRAIAMMNAGIAGDTLLLTDTLAFFRSIGLEDVARRVGLQLLLLERQR